MEKLKDLGLHNDDALFISCIVELFVHDSLMELTLRVRKQIKNIHTGHFIYLGVVYGEMIAGREQLRSTFNNQNNLN